jgi:hypothetical protein
LTSPLQRRHSNKSSRIAMGPTGLFETGTEWDGPISETDRAALTAGTKAIYIFGQIEYRDTFGKHWFTEFRFMEGGRVSLPSKWRRPPTLPRG